MPKWIIPIGMLVAAALAAWMLLLPADRPAARHHAPSPRRESRAKDAPGAEPRESAGARDPDSEPPVPVLPYEDPDAPAVDADAAGTSVLHVVEAGTGRPVAGARVRFLELGAVAQEEFVAASTLRPDPADAMEHRGRLLRADGSGDATLPPYQGNALVTGEFDGLFGLAAIGDPESGPHKLELRADREVLVDVVDAAGAPVAEAPLLLEPRRGRGDSPLWTGTTREPDGRTSIRHFGWLTNDPNRADTEFAVRFRFPVDRGGEAVIDRASPPDAPLRLEIPGTGRLVVTVEGADGGPATPGAYVTLEKSREDSAPGGAKSPGGAKRPPPARVRVEGSRAVFPHVGTGLDLEVTAATFAQDVRPVTARIHGPESPGEEVTVQLVLRERFPSLVARAEDGEGHPVAHRRISAQVAGLKGVLLGMGTTTTDADGLFRFSLKVDDAGDAAGRAPTVDRPRLELTAARAPKLFPDQNGPRATLPLPARIPDGETDYGTVAFLVPPLVAGGMILDGEGHPLAKVNLGIERLAGPPGKGKTPNWQRLWKLSAPSNGDGSFEIRGDCDPGDLRIVAETDGYYETGRPAFALGSAALRVVVQRAGSIEGTVLLPDSLPAQRLNVNVVGLPASTYRSGPVIDDPRNARLPSAIDRDSRFRFQRLKPGTADVSFTIGWSGETVLTIPGVEVAAGETTRDPRLQSVDLRERVNAFQVRIVDVSGAPVPAAEIEAGSPDGRGPVESATTDKAGRALLVSSRSSVDLTIRARGFRETRVERIDGDRQIVLPVALPVRLLLTGDWTVPETPYALTVALVPAAAKDRPVAGKATRGTPPETVTPARDAKLAMTAPGLYRVALSLVRHSEGRTRSRALRSADADVIDVLDSNLEQVFQVPIRRESLLAAYENLKN